MIDMLPNTLRGLVGHEHASQGLGALGLTLSVLYWSYFHFLPAWTLRKIPRAGKDPGFLGLRLIDAKIDFKKNGLKVLEEGYRKYKNYMFKVQTLNVERVVLSPAYVEEINKNVSEDVLDITEGLSERLMGPYTNLEVVFKSEMHIDVCKVQLTQNLPKLIAPINEEAEYWLKERISGQTELKVYDLIVRIIAGTATRMLGGSTASRNIEWLESAAQYSYDVVATAQHLRQWSPFLRPVVAPFLNGKKKLDRHLAVANKTFRHVFVERLELIERGGVSDAKKPIDMAQWMVESARGNDRNPDVLAQNMLFMTLAGLHTSTNTTVHALFDLCANPDFIKPLREEIEQVIGQDGWSMNALGKLKKLDSFIKESQRLNQTVLMTFNRRLKKSLRFADGTTLPSGTYITMPSVPVSRDPEIFEDPEKFNGSRFFDKRSSAKSEAFRHQFATIGPESLAFGFGKTACPGRFFAGAQIKAVLANIILSYDISFPAGQTERPENLYKGGLIRPDPSQKIVFNPRCK